MSETYHVYNCRGYTRREIAALNAELDAILEARELQPYSDEWYDTIFAHSDAVPVRKEVRHDHEQ